MFEKNKKKIIRIFLKTQLVLAQKNFKLKKLFRKFIIKIEFLDLLILF